MGDDVPEWTSVGAGLFWLAAAGIVWWSGLPRLEAQRG